MKLYIWDQFIKILCDEDVFSWSKKKLRNWIAPKNLIYRSRIKRSLPALRFVQQKKITKCSKNEIQSRNSQKFIIEDDFPLSLKSCFLCVIPDPQLNLTTFCLTLVAFSEELRNQRIPLPFSFSICNWQSR